MEDMQNMRAKKYLNNALKMLLLAAVLFAFAAVAVSCAQTDGSGGGADIEADSYTLLIYMCASDLESDFGAATANINELLKADVPTDTNIVIQAGGTKRWRNDFFSTAVTERAVIKDKWLNSVERIPKANFGDAATLSSFIKLGVENYPADDYGIIFWDHGGGSLSGVCFDELYDFDSLSLDELEDGLAYGTSLIGHKFDFVGFDACLMASYETASMVAPYAKTMIASQENEPSAGWNYTAVAQNVGEDDFYDKTLSAYAEKCRTKNKQTFTLSVTDLTKFDTVKTALNGFVADLNEIQLPQIVRSAGKAQCFGTNKRNVFTDLVDLTGFSAAVGNTEVGEAIADCVTSVVGDYRKGASGMSIYYPLNSTEEVSTYLEMSGDSGYKSFLRDNYVGASGRQIFIVNGGTDDNGKLKAQVSSDSVKKIIKTTYKLFRIQIEDDVETVYGMGEDTDVAYDGVNGYTVSFEGRWVTFNGCYINCSVEKDGEAYTEYSSPLKVNGEEAEMRFVFEKNSRTVKLQGYALTGGENGLAGRINDFVVGDRLTLMYDDRTDYVSNLIEGDTFEYSEALLPQISYLPVGYYQYNMFFYDAYNKEYRSDTAVVYFDGTNTSITVISDDQDIYG